MNIKKINSLVELFFQKFKETNNKKAFLTWLKKDNNNHYSWEEVAEKILKLSIEIKKLIKEGDRCILLSENRP